LLAPSPHPPIAPPTVLLLAAGRGTRFLASGGSTHKLQALLHGKTVLQHTLDAVVAAGLPYQVVAPTHDGLLLGMGDSIARGVAATHGAAGWLVLPADLPMIAPATIRAVAGALAASGAAVVQPRVLGQAAHPVAFSAACREGLLALAGSRSDAGARSIVQHYQALELLHTLALADAGALMDVDTVDDLARVSSAST
jgi:molybdenum cofactor cytidylyltransferase